MNTPAAPSHRRIILIGLVALAVAMGVGRFAFTPLMPLMMRDATLDVATGAEWAAANYVGYLVGALSAPWFAANPQRGLQLGLMGVAVSTLGMAGVDHSPAWSGGWLRGVSGICSAWVLVCASSWCLPELTRLQAAAKSGWIYAGVGTGIALTGTLTWLGGHQLAWVLWIELALLAAMGSAYVRWALPSSSHVTPGHAANASLLNTPSKGGHSRGLILCYGAFGYGYIVSATFLPTMARQLVDDPLIFGLTWPLFGLAAALSVALAARGLGHWPRRQVWALAQAVMAMGTLIPLLQQSLWALTLSAMLVGGTFMVATMAGLQLARERMPANPTPLLARMTGAFAAGQIAGPLLVRLMATQDLTQAAALQWASGLATLILMVTSVWLWRVK